MTIAQAKLPLSFIPGKIQKEVTQLSNFETTKWNPKTKQDFKELY